MLVISYIDYFENRRYATAFRIDKQTILTYTLIVLTTRDNIMIIKAAATTILLLTATASIAGPNNYIYASDAGVITSLDHNGENYNPGNKKDIG